MAVKTRQQDRAQGSESDPFEQSRELPTVSTRPSLVEERTAAKLLQKPENPEGGHDLLLDLPPQLRIDIYEYCVAAEGPFSMVETLSPYVEIVDIKKSHTPGLLTVNRQTREEALPIFYKTNEFSFEGCHAKYINRWLFRAVQSQHLKLINAISWPSGLEKTSKACEPAAPQGYYNKVVAVYSKAAQDQAINTSSVIMLLELGLLGQCKVKMSLYNEPRLHVACRLRELARKTIVRKTLAKANACNENNVPGEDDVAGLSYAMAKEWGKSAPQVFYDRAPAPFLAPEMYCSSCQTVSMSRYLGWEGMISRLPWVSRSEGAETDQSEEESSTTASDLGSRVTVSLPVEYVA